MSGEVKVGFPCEPCMVARIFPDQAEAHECTGVAALADGTMPCPCCGTQKDRPSFCDRCGEPFTLGDEYEAYDQFSPSGAAPTVYVHKGLCERPPSQSSPVAGLYRKLER